MFMFELKNSLKSYIVLEDRIKILWRKYIVGRDSFNYDVWILTDEFARGLYVTQNHILKELEMDRMHDIEGHDETDVFIATALTLLEKIDE